MFELQKNKQVRSYIIKGYCSFQILSGNGDTRAKGCAPVTTHFCDKNKEYPFIYKFVQVYSFVINRKKISYVSTTNLRNRHDIVKFCTEIWK